FQKAEADLDYIQRSLELEIMKNLPDDAAEEVNPVALLKQLSALKARYKSLCERMDAISKEQKESMESIRAALGNTMQLIRTLQQRSQLE
ncbi:SKA2 protein, partial [Regulus satrapa]|nr:SKA2 protein [Regulus satrapa]